MENVVKESSKAKTSKAVQAAMVKNPWHRQGNGIQDANSEQRERFDMDIKGVKILKTKE